MTNLDHSRRVARLFRGERNVTDLDRLFADLRFADPGRGTVREIGDFAAHRTERDKGIVMKRAGDMQTSARIWLRQQRGIMPSIEDARAAGTANLNIATDEQIRNRLKTSRQQARALFVQGMNKLAAGNHIGKKERAAVNWLGTSFIWLNAFDDDRLVEDLADVLTETGALAVADRSAFSACGPFITLHALTLMHGARLLLPDGDCAPLRISVRQETGTLRIRAEIPLEDIGKPVGCRVSLFETGLPAKDHCKPGLIIDGAAGDGPVEIDPDGQLAEIV
jgi:hypothetical protein